MPAALFDLDETLLERTGSLKAFAYWQAREVLGVNNNLQDDFVARFVELDQNGTVWKDKVYNSLIREFKLSHCTVDGLLDKYLHQFCEFCKARSGALDVIEAFHQKGFKLGFVTNGKTPFQERNFKALGFDDYFDCVVVSEAVGLRKPDKEIFKLASAEIAVPENACIFIGDNPIADMQGAKNAGMSTIYVPVDPAIVSCEFADHTFNDLSEFAEFVICNY